MVGARPVGIPDIRRLIMFTLETTGPKAVRYESETYIAFFTERKSAARL